MSKARAARASAKRGDEPYYVVGFDLSLRAPAAVALPIDWRPGDWKRARSWTLRPEAPAGDDLAGQLDRYRAIATWALDVAADAHAIAAFVEDYGFSKNNTATARIHGSGEIVKLHLYEFAHLILRPVASSAARKLLLGKVPRSDAKVHVQRAAYAAGAPKTWGEDEIDAFAIANFGLSEQGGVALLLHTTSPPRRKRAA